MLRCDFVGQEGEGVKVLLRLRFDAVSLQRIVCTHNCSVVLFYAPMVGAYSDCKSCE